MKKSIKLASKIAAHVLTVAFGVTLIGGNILLSPDAAGQINSMLNVSTQEVIPDPNATPQNYFDTKYTSIAQLKQSVGDTVSKISEEGCVLLKNANKALPLSAGAKVNLYSSSSVNYVYSGGGSSWASSAKFTNLKDGLEASGLSVNADLWNFYANNKSYSGAHNSTTGTDAASYKINDAAWSALPAAASEKAEAGVFVLSRYGTEGSDPYMSGGSIANFNNSTPTPSTNTDTTNGDYLSLSPNEISVLKGMKALKDQGKLDKIVILLNSVNQVQCDYIDKEEYGIDSILWVGEGGSTGTIGIGKILSGKTNPSGRLTDTYWVNHAYNPVYANFGNFQYQGESLSNNVKSRSYTVYQEGIYNGYRYTETRYEDTVLGRANVGDFNYDSVVAYPFGYGLSYSTFEYSNFKLAYNNAKDTYTATVDVKNTGSQAGKEAVQLYLQKPYTDYDIANGIEKASVELVGYAKTDVIEAGKTQKNVTINMDGKWLASYDAYGEGTYIVENGDYYFTVAKDAHNAVNNILQLKNTENKQGVTVNANKITDSRTDKGNEKLAVSKTIGMDKNSYSKSVTGKNITNQFSNADINLYSGKGDNTVTYVSRNNWAGTVKFGLDENHTRLQNQVVLTTTSQMIADSQKGSAKITTDDVEYPTYGKTAEGGLKTIMSLISTDDNGKYVPVEYDDPRWEEILDQLTWDETCMLLSNGLRKTYGISIKPETVDLNGALGPTGYRNGAGYGGQTSAAENRFAFQYDDPDIKTYPVCYPCAALTASTMNDDLANELGDAIGEDCLWLGFSGLYGPGLNIHRGQYNGRAFEYYSEDALLSGYICASQVKGIRSHGVYVYAKHCLLNDQEHNREGICAWANEQTIRENYLRAFEIAIEEGGSDCVMTGFNRLGVVWTGAHGFVENVLRQEFGMDGFAVSDYWQGYYMDLVGSIMGGSAIPDGDNARNASASELYKYGPNDSGNYGQLAQNMREQAHRILYKVVNSNAINGQTAGTKYRTVTPAWMIAVQSVQIVVIVLFSLSLAAYIVTANWDLIITTYKKVFKKKDSDNSSEN